jgi:hypothetical protein
VRCSTLKPTARPQAHLDEMQLATSAPPRYVALPFPHLHRQQRAPAAAPALPPLRILVAEDNLVGAPCSRKTMKLRCTMLCCAHCGCSIMHTIL